MSPTAGTWGTRGVVELSVREWFVEGRASRDTHVPDCRDMGHPFDTHVPNGRDMGHPDLWLRLRVREWFVEGRASRDTHVPNGRDMGHPVLFRSQVGLTQLWGWGSVCRIDNTWAEGSLCSFGPLR